MRKSILVIIITLLLPVTSMAESDDVGAIEQFIHSLIIDNDSLDISSHLLAFNESTVNNIVDSLIMDGEKNGFYYTNVTVDRVVKFENFVTLYLSVSNGPKVKIANLRFEGLKRTNPEYLKKYFPDFEQEQFSSKISDRILDISSEINFLDFNKPPYLEAVPGYQSFDLVIPVKESKSVLFNGGAGVIQDDGSVFVWDFQLDFVNPFGSGRELSILSEKRDKNNQLLGFHYTQPLFLIGNDQLKLSLNSRDYRDLFYEFSVFGKYTIKLKSRWKGSLKLSAKNVEPEDDIDSYRSYTSEVLLNYRSKLNKHNFSKFVLDWSIAYSHRKYKSDSTYENSGKALNETRNEIAVYITRPIAGSFTPHFSLKYVGLETSEDLPPISELYLIGGPGKIRGFRNEQFPAVRSLMSTFEPRFYFSQSYLFSFVDIALISNRVLRSNDLIETDNQWQSGYGFGFFLSGERNNVKMSLGWNKELPIDKPRLSIELQSSF